MTNVRARLLGATLGAIVAFAIGGASFAVAQTADDSTTTTTPPAADTPAVPATPAPAAPAPHDPANCPNMGGNDGSGAGYHHMRAPQPPAAPSNV